MSPSSSDFPSAQEALSLHLRLCDDDPTATSDVCAACLGPLVRWLASCFREVHPDDCQTAAHQALLSYFRDPQRYRPDDLPLSAYLRMAARGDLLNLLAKERRHHRRRVSWSAVELDEDGRNLLGTDEDPSRLLEQEEEREEARAVLDAVRRRCTEAEAGALDLMLDGVRDTAAYAAVLGLGGLPVPEQERAVKRVKDRIVKRLERERARHE
jgi:DNA-directed RNA polymerase specialized sigma24 family protein